MLESVSNNTGTKSCNSMGNCTSNDSPKKVGKEIRGNIMSLNIRGLVNKDHNKIVKLSQLTKMKNIVVMALQETHARGLEPNETNIPGFREFAQNRTMRACGGVSTYVDQRFTVKDVLGFSNDYVEVMCIRIIELYLDVVNIYRPPQCPTDRFIEAMEVVAGWGKHRDGDCLLMGDLNFPSAGCWGPAEVYEMRRQETTRNKVESL